MSSSGKMGPMLVPNPLNSKENSCHPIDGPPDKRDVGYASSLWHARSTWRVLRR